MPVLPFVTVLLFRLAPPADGQAVLVYGGAVLVLQRVRASQQDVIGHRHLGRGDDRHLDNLGTGRGRQGRPGLSLDD